jgi:hypothetical protein
MAQTDQIAIQLSKPRWNEGSAFNAVAYFRDRATSAAVTPTTVKYRLDCLATGKALVGWTTLSAASSVTVPVSATANAIQSDANKSERKQLTVKADDGLSTQFEDAVVYTVDNLYGSP